MYLYVRRKFNWNAKTFGSYIGFYGFLGMFAQYVAIPFLSGYMHLHDTTIGNTHLILYQFERNIFIVAFFYSLQV